MKRAILHIGQGKTGTSVIQRSLYDSRDELKKNGIYYPYLKPYNHGKTFWMFFSTYNQLSDLNIPIFIKRDIEKGKSLKNQVSRYKEIWTSMFESNKLSNFLISAEIMSLMNRDEVQSLKEYLSQYFDEFSIIAYVRHYDTFISSITQQQIKACYNAYSIQEQVDSLMESEWFILYYRFLEKWIDVFGRESVIVRPYDRVNFKNGNILNDFYDILGLDMNAKVESKSISNTSLGHNGVNFLVEFNKKYPCLQDGELNKNRGLFKRSLPFGIFRVQNDEKFYHNAYISEENLNRLNDEIEWVNQFFDDDYKFDPFEYHHKENYTNNTSNISTEFYVEVVNEFAKLVDKKTDDIEKYKIRIKELTKENKKLKRELSENSNNLLIRFLKKIKNKIKRK